MFMDPIYPEGSSFNFTYFSRLMGREVVDQSGAYIGKAYDILATQAGIYPKAVELLINRGFIRQRFATVPWVTLVEINNRIRLNIKRRAIKFGKLKDPRIEISLRRDVLDQQVVDTSNRRVVRVNDLHLLKVGMDLMVAHIDIGLKGILRRLGLKSFFDLSASFFKNSSYVKKENFISWKYIHIISVNKANHNVKVSMPYDQISGIHPSELSEIILDLGSEQKLALFRGLDVEIQAKLFTEIDDGTQKFLIQGMEMKENARLLAALPSDEAADFLDNFPEETVVQLLSMIDAGRAKKLTALLGYPGDTAGGLMTTEYISVSKMLSVGDVLVRVKESNLKSEMIYYVYVVDENNHLVGSTTLKKIIAANPGDNILVHSATKIAAVHINDGVKEAAFLIEKYRLYALPVIDENRVLHGIITVDDILEHLINLVWHRKTRI